MVTFGQGWRQSPLRRRQEPESRRSGSHAPAASDIRLLYGLYFGFVGASGPYLPLLFDAWGMVAVQIGALVALSHLIRIFAPPIWGWAADRNGRVRMLLRGGAVAMAAACLLLLLTDRFDPTTRFWVAAGLISTLHLAGAGQGPLTETMALRLCAGDLGRYGRMRVWGSVGYIVTVVGVGPMLDRFGIAALPWGLAVLCVALWAALGRLPSASRGSTTAQGDAWRDGSSSFRATSSRSPGQDPASKFPDPALRTRDPSSRVRDQMRRPATLAFLLSSLLMIMAHAPFYGFFSLYLAELGFSGAAIGQFWALGVVVEVGLFLTQRRLFDRFAATTLLMATMLLAVVRFGLTAAAGSMALEYAVGTLILAQCLHAATFALHHSTSMSLMQQRFGADLQARAQSLYTAISYGIGGALGGMGAGAIWQTWGSAATFYAAAGVALAGALAVAGIRIGLAAELDRTKRASE